MGKTNDRRFREAVAAILDLQVDDITDDISSVKTYHWDSLNQTLLLTALEEEFGVTLPTSTTEAEYTVVALKYFLAQRGVRV